MRLGDSGGGGGGVMEHPHSGNSQQTVSECGEQPCCISIALFPNSISPPKQVCLLVGLFFCCFFKAAKVRSL